MISHRNIWNAIDALAERKGLSVSALARLAGLDPTSFNPSKRTSKDGRERWPSTESLAKILDATNEDMDGFLAGGGVYTQPDIHEHPIPLLGFAQAGAGGFFDSGGFPVGQGWDEVHFPVGPDANAYALEVSGDSMLPLYRDGDVIIVSPTEQVRRGDRVVVRTQDGEVMAKILHRQTANQVELHSINPEHEPRIIKSKDLDWIARILWASQ
ncbi:phage repressor protein C with HTH and peptisase S24 domain [Maritalea mobilis]|uniref:Phage repressor protein C with HTH and peptisase S24 domain n=1 Tax=Maritalea mobilis TaxID=483324 RepID=A0A4R6VPG8_9HYPH|nr:helix-turn-helix transcriptional regulator [Maritalea mobilis]TDQ64130.1 phage repressor protein C with HTH and peptisase S24 domain [Maritalea mobilis]